MLVYIHNKKKCQKIVESCIISNHNPIKQTWLFQFITLFSQINAKKLQNRLKGQLAKIFGEEYMQQPANSKNMHIGYTT